MGFIPKAKKAKTDGPVKIKSNVIGERLRSLRRAHELTLADVSRVLGFENHTAYHKYERGLVIPPPEKLMALAKLFNVTVDYLLRPPGPDGGPQSALESGPLANAMRLECTEAFQAALAKAGRDVGQLDRLLGHLKRAAKEL